MDLRLSGTVAATDIDATAPALRVVDHPYLVPRISAPDYVQTIVAICKRDRVKTIFPLIDPDLSILADNRSLFEEAGVSPVVVDPHAVALTGDKWLTTEFFRKLGLTTPATWLPTDIAGSRLTYPVFIKPRHGSAAQHTYPVRSDQEMAFFLNYVPDPIIQDYLPGPEVTSDVICDLHGSILSIVSRQRVEVRSGEVAKGVTVYNPTIIEACVRIAEALPAIGPITVQCMMKDGVPHFTEINARLGGGAPLGIAAGADWPRWLLARIAGIPVEIPPLGSYRTGVYMTRFDDSFFLTEADLAKMESHRL